MKEIDGWVKIKKYMDDEGKPVCGKCRWLTYCEDVSGAGADMFTPSPSCEVWQGESKSEDPRYQELIMAVAQKCPGETRHETALRYIMQAEAPKTTCCASQEKQTMSARRSEYGL